MFSVLSLSGCENNNDISGVLSDTVSTVSTAAVSESKTETSPQNSETETTVTDTVSGIEAGFDIDGIEVFRGEYTLPDIREEFDEKLSEWRDANDIVSPRFRYANIDGCIVISAYSGEFAGNTQTSYVIVDCGDKIIEIDAGDIDNINPIYFVGNGVLYCCDSSSTAGYKRFVLTEFSLTNGEKLNEYSDVHSLGDTSDNYITTDPDIGSVDELKSYIFDISPRWYYMESMMWDGYVPVE